MSKNLFQEHELTAYLGDSIEGFDVEAIIDEATEIDYRDGNRYWKDDIDLAEICAKHDATLKPTEDEIIYNDWYAVDSYDPTDGKMTRVYVGDEEHAHKLIRDYFSQPQELAMGKFYRCKLLSIEETRDYFNGSTDIQDERTVYSVTETAQMLGITRQRVLALLKSGKLEGEKVGTTWSIYRYSVENRLKS